MKTTPLTKLIATGFALALSAVVTPASAAWDATADYSASSSTAVNGVWSYGYSASAFGSFTAFSNNTTVSGASTQGSGGAGSLNNWFVPSSFSLPGLGKAGGSQFIGYNTVRIDANTLWAHPTGTDYSVLRFVAPSAGQYQVNASFFGEDTRPAGGTTDVHVGNSVQNLYSATVSTAYGVASSAPAFSQVVTLAAGESLYFSVGHGAEVGGDNFYYDSTGLQATIAAVPEPGEWAMMAAGLGVIGAAARRRRRG